MKYYHLIRAAVFLIIASSVAVANDRFSLDGTLFETVAIDHGIDPLLLYAIAITESATSAGNGNIGPTPYVFRTNDGPRFFETQREAKTELATILKTTRNVDVGMMQINLRYHPQPDPLDLLDPHHNLTVAAKYLKKTMSSTTDPIIGVGRYHSWTEELARWYGERVWQTYRNILQIKNIQ